MGEPPIRALFVDIGGVLATNGWDTDTRHQAVEHFGLDAKETDSRHRLTFELYETAKLTWYEYLDEVIFHRPRPFTREQFTDFVLAQSRPFPDMLDLVAGVKRAAGLKVVAVSNEGRELTEHRLRKFNLCAVVDFFVASCFVRLRKPDQAIYRVALDLSQVAPEQVAYLEDRDMFVEVAGKLGIRAILHRDVASTRAALAAMGLTASPNAAEPA